MPNLNIINSRRRYASNVLWMTALLKYVNEKMKGPEQANLGLFDGNQHVLKAWLDELIVSLRKAHVPKYLSVTTNQEFVAFRETVCQKGILDDDLLNKQMTFQYDCLPAEIKSLTENIADNLVDSKKIVIAILTLMYLTRETIGITEDLLLNEFVTKNIIKDPLEDQKKLFGLCNRIRASTFASLAPGCDYQNIEMQKVVKFYEEWGEKAGSPFCDKWRVRDKKSSLMNRDDQILTMWSGSHKVPVDTGKSVMGMIERVFNLPERCDISGTTTDAVAFGVHSEVNNADLFVLLNIYGMILSGHHSLCETVAAASLWSTKCYMPFDPVSILLVLGDLFKKDGHIKVSRTLDEFYDRLTDDETDINTEIIEYNYTKHLWRELAGYNQAGTRSKYEYQMDRLEINQPLYTMAKHLCTVVSKK